MKNWHIFDLFVESGIIIVIIYSFLYYLGYVFYNSLVNLMGYSIDYFNINKYNFLLLGFPSLKFSLTVIALFLLFAGILFLFIFTRPFFMFIKFLSSSIDNIIDGLPLIKRTQKKLDTNFPEHLSKTIIENREILLEKILITFTIIIYFYFIFFISSFYAQSTSRNFYKYKIENAKNATITLKDNNNIQGKYIMNIGDKIICKLNGAIVAIDQSVVKSIKLYDKNKIRKDNVIKKSNI